MTLRNLIDHGLLNNTSMICIADCETVPSFQIEDDFLKLHRKNERVLLFPLNNEVIFDGLFLTVEDELEIEYDLSFLNCTTIDPESFKNK